MQPTKNKKKKKKNAKFENVGNRMVEDEDE